MAPTGAMVAVHMPGRSDTNRSKGVRRMACRTALRQNSPQAEPGCCGACPWTTTGTKPASARSAKTRADAWPPGVALTTCSAS